MPHAVSLERRKGGFFQRERRPPWGSKRKAARARCPSASGYVGPTPENSVSTHLIVLLRK
jgi:hypothetical protein